VFALLPLDHTYDVDDRDFQDGVQSDGVYLVSLNDVLSQMQLKYMDPQRPGAILDPALKYYQGLAGPDPDSGADPYRDQRQRPGDDDVADIVSLLPGLKAKLQDD